MKNDEALYSDIPPSKQRMDTKPFISSEISPFCVSVCNMIFYKMLESSFNSIRVKNVENYELRNPEKGNIFYGLHSCWWDGMVSYYLCKKILGTNIRMMIEQLHQFPVLAKIGAFSVDKKSTSSVIKALNYSVDIVKDPKTSLWLFPQGIVKPPEHRPVKFNSGISYLCRQVDGVNLFPVAVKYSFLRENKPEILIEIGSPIIVNNDNFNREEFTEFLEHDMTELADKQRLEISKGNLDGYKTFYQSKIGLFKRIEKYLRKY